MSVPDDRKGIVLGVTGGRAYSGPGLVNALDAIHYGPRGPVRVLAVGDARGADRIALHWAARRGITRRVFVADWGQFGRSAGPVRNQAMVDFVAAQELPRLWVCAPGGRGTRDCRARAEAAGIEIVEVEG